jgi:hypothetical protein
MSDLAERLNKAAGGGDAQEGEEDRRIAEFTGQTVTVVSFEEKPTKFGPKVIATILDAEGNEVVILTTPTSGRQVKEVADQLPLELKVVSFDSNFGPGYKFELV